MDEIERRGFGHGNASGKKLDGVDGSETACFWDINGIAAVMVEGWTNIPTVKSMRRPGGTLAGLFVQNEFGSGWDKRGPIEIELPPDLCIGAEVGVDLGLSEEIEGDCGLRDEGAPQVERKVRVGGGKASNEMVLKCSDGALRSVAAMDVWWGQLEGDTVVLQTCFESVGGFVVKAM